MRKSVFLSELFAFINADGSIPYQHNVKRAKSIDWCNASLSFLVAVVRM